MKGLFLIHIAALYGTFDGIRLTHDEIVEIPLSEVRDQKILVDILLKR